MSKYTIKKLIIAIIFLLILNFVFYITYTYKRNTTVKNISVVKKIINDKYDEIVHDNNSKYLYGYTYNDGVYNYDVYDLSGNKLYSIVDSKELNIESVNKYYYIINNGDNYNLYNDDNELVTSAGYLKSINDDLFISDNKLMNRKNEVKIDKIKDVQGIHSVSHDYYFSIDNLLVDEDGNVVLDNVEVVEEVDVNFITNYVIIRKDNKYYSFFPSFNTIVGESFDNYYKDNDKVYINSKNNIYSINSAGLRKKEFTVDNYDSIIKDYDFEMDDLINKEYAFVTRKRDNTFGLLDIKNEKYNKILDTVYDYKKIDDSHYLLNNGKQYIYDIDSKKIVYESEFDLSEIVYYKNDYKVIKKDNKYILLDDKNESVVSSQKQIIALDYKYEYGIINDEVSVYKKNELYDGKKASIDSRTFIYYEDKIINLNTKEEYSSSDYLDYSDSVITYKNKKELVIKNFDKDRNYSYELENNSKVNRLFMNSIIIENDNEFVVVNTKGKEIKKIKGEKIEKIYYNDKYNKIVIITYDDENKKGSYLCQ